MEKSANDKINLCLNKCFPIWSNLFPNLLSYFEVLIADKDGSTPLIRGDIYFLYEGSIGLYKNNQPIRFACIDELIIEPVAQNDIILRAFEKSKLLKLSVKNLFCIDEKAILIKEFYDALCVAQSEAQNFRYTLWELPKKSRFEALMNKYRALYNKVKKKDITSYLNISMQTLNRQY